MQILKNYDFKGIFGNLLTVDLSNPTVWKRRQQKIPMSFDSQHQGEHPKCCKVHERVLLSCSRHLMQEQEKDLESSFRGFLENFW